MSSLAKRPLKVREVADALGLSVHTVRTWISQRRLAHLRLGRAIRVLPAEVETLLTNSAVPARDWLCGSPHPSTQRPVRQDPEQ